MLIEAEGEGMEPLDREKHWWMFYEHPLKMASRIAQLGDPMLDTAKFPPSLSYWEPRDYQCWHCWGYGHKANECDERWCRLAARMKEEQNREWKAREAEKAAKTPASSARGSGSAAAVTSSTSRSQPPPAKL